MTGLLVPPQDLVLPDEPGEPSLDAIRRAIAVAEAAGAEADIDALVTLLQQRLARGWRRSPSAMGAYLTGGVLRRWRYVEYLSRKFVDAATGRSPRQIWNLPTRYGKSTIARWGVTWALDRSSGQARLIFVSYADSLARENSVIVRDMARTYADHLAFDLQPDRRQQDRWNTSAGGGLKSDGIMGGILGFGAGGGAYDPELGEFVRGGIMLDDPYGGWAQAHSAAERKKVRDQFKGTIRNRLDEEEAWIIVIQQRLHDEDLTHTLLEDTANATGDTWEHVCLPALAYDDGTPDPLGREPGEPLEPERFSGDDVHARARGLGPYLAAAQEQQRPLKAEGTEIRRDWFVLVPPEEWPGKPTRRAIASWDLKLKDNERGDFVVGQAWWPVGAARYLVDQVRGQWDHATTANAIALLQVRVPTIHRHHIESAGAIEEVTALLRTPQAGYVVSPEMQARLRMTDDEARAVEHLRRSGMTNLVAEKVTEGAKPVRARIYIGRYADSGNLRLPAGAPWVDGYLDEVTAFPEGLHDDQVDASSLGLKVLHAKPGGGGGMATATGAIPR